MADGSSAGLPPAALRLAGVVFLTTATDVVGMGSLLMLATLFVL